MNKRDQINAKDEFLYKLGKNKITGANISFGDHWYDNDNFKDDRFVLKPLHSKEDYDNFLKFLDREYDNGYGSQDLFGIVLCEDGVWMQRNQYDGSEWWEVMKYPNIRDVFDEIDVLKYERNKKLKNIGNI